MASEIKVLRVAPYDPVLGLLVPLVTQRIKTMAEHSADEMDPGVMAQQVMTRLFAGDPTILVLAMVDETGKVVGHAVVTMQTDGVRKWAYVLQCRADGNVGDAVKRAIAYGDAWAKEHEADRMLMITTRIDGAWQRRYKFSTVRHVMSRDIGAGFGEVEASEPAK